MNDKYLSNILYVILGGILAFLIIYFVFSDFTDTEKTKTAFETFKEQCLLGGGELVGDGAFLEQIEGRIGLISVYVDCEEEYCVDGYFCKNR